AQHVLGGGGELLPGAAEPAGAAAGRPGGRARPGQAHADPGAGPEDAGPAARLGARRRADHRARRRPERARHHLRRLVAHPAARRVEARRVSRYVLRRLGASFAVLWAAYTVTFVVLYLLPGDPVTTRASGGLDGEPLTPAAIEALKARYGFDNPLVVQYGDRLWAALHGDLGASIQTGQDV